MAAIALLTVSCGVGSDAVATSGAEGAFPTSQVTVADSELRVWVADASEERSQGLRGVTGLPEGIDGMLFEWDTPTAAVFVMEDTLIPLDVWFFDESGVLIGSEHMTPCATEPCARYPAPGLVLWALETPAGAREFVAGDELSTSASG